MPERPFLTATLIAKNEKDHVADCLDSIWPHVDEVVIVDTGSTDGTIAAAHRYAKAHKQPSKLKTARFTDCNDEHGEIKDFASARQAADALATGEWLVWADFDDVVHGLDQLRQFALEAADDTLAYFTQYSYARDPTGNSISELWRERVVRNDGTPWTGRLHEHKLFTKGGTVIKVDPSVCEWIHMRDHEQRTSERNLRILESWNQDEPGNSRILCALALEYMGADRQKDASDTFAKFLQCEGEPPDRRAQSTRHMCMMLMLQGRVDEARAAAFAALPDLYGWADTHLTLAEVEQTLGHPDLGMLHAETALTIGKPDTLLIVNPLQYTAHPLALQAVCLSQMGRYEDAVAKAEECLRIAPTYQLAAQHVPMWRGQVKKQHALGTCLAMCDVLVEVGELEKAQTMLENAPYYVADEPALIARRAELRREISRRTTEPSPAIADEAADAFEQRHLQEAA